MFSYFLFYWIQVVTIAFEFVAGSCMNNMCIRSNIVCKDIECPNANPNRDNDYDYVEDLHFFFTERIICVSRNPLLTHWGI